jgi:coatomer protein complex subunit gamma
VCVFLSRHFFSIQYRSILSSPLTPLNAIPSHQARELGLDNLCEFVEDCEFPELAVQVLHVLAEEASRIKSNPARFIRHIYNRVILECEPVRAGAVSALAKIGASGTHALAFFLPRSLALCLL